jgi:hypothetical protein
MNDEHGALPACPQELPLAERAASLRVQSRVMCMHFVEDAGQCAVLRREAADVCRKARRLREATRDAAVAALEVAGTSPRLAGSGVC